MPPKPARKAEPPTDIVLPVLASFADPTLEPGGDYEAIDFSGLDLADQRADDAAFLGCQVIRCRVGGLGLQRARLTDCLLRDLDGPTVDATDAVWRGSLLDHSRIGALTAPGAAWTEVRVRGSAISFAVLSGARLRNVVFEDCVFGELDLGESRLESVRFEGCTVDDLDVEGAWLEGVDLSGLAIRLLRGVGSLRGAIVSPEQLLDLAPLLAVHLGIAIRGDQASILRR